jgi:hypothetical protein
MLLVCKEELMINSTVDKNEPTTGNAKDHTTLGG